MIQVIYYDADGVKIFCPATRDIDVALAALDLARHLGHFNAAAVGVMPRLATGSRANHTERHPLS